jgi:hypothetical protein
MSALSGKGLRDRWIANAESLDKQGHFASYSPKQREEVLKKGFLGRYPPVGAEVRDKLLQVLDEIPPESYQPPSEISEPPGCPFIFRCSVLGCEIYFKFQIEGTARKPRVLFWSCHPPRYEIKREES